MPYRSKCAKCDKNAVLKWTLYNGQVSVIVPLCVEHGSPLTELVNLVGPKPVEITGPIPTTRLPKARPLSAAERAKFQGL